MAVREARAPDAARTKREQRLHDLIGHAIRVGPGIPPDVKAHAHMAEHRIACGGREAEDRERDDDIRAAARRHVRHEDRNAEEQQRRTEVARHDEHQDRHAPDAEERRDETDRRQAEKAEPAPRLRQHILMV